MHPPKAATTSPPSIGPGLCLLLACSCGSPGIPAVNTLQGEEAFSLEAVAAYYNPLLDGGPDLGSFAIQASDRLPSFCGAADAGAAGPNHVINVEITARAGEVVSPGTFPIGLPPEIQPPFAEISLSATTQPDGEPRRPEHMPGRGGLTHRPEHEAHNRLFAAPHEQPSANRSSEPWTSRRVRPRL